MVCRIAVLKDIACKCAKGTVYVMRRSAVQRLYEICKETFSGNDIFNAVPPPEAQLHRLRSFLDTIKPADVGLDENEWLDRQPRFGNSRTANRRGSRHSSSVQARWPPPPVTYVHVYQCNEFSIGIFCLPTSAVIPLHDHPGMTVCSKILYGSMHIKAYDWTYPANIRRNTWTIEFGIIKAQHCRERGFISTQRLHIIVTSICGYLFIFRKSILFIFQHRLFFYIISGYVSLEDQTV